MNNPRRISLPICLIFLAMFSTSDGRSQQRSAPSVDQAREILERGTPNAVLGPISLEGLNYFREIGLGKGFRVFVLSKSTGGGLLLFSPRGVLQSSVSTGEITWIQIFDLSDDGVSELVTEEIEGHGTGILVKNFKVYMAGDEGIKEIWKRLSYRRESPWNSEHMAQRGREIHCFLRFDEASAGSVSHMTYAEPLRNPGQFRETQYVMSGSIIRQVSEVQVDSGK